MARWVGFGAVALALLGACGGKLAPTPDGGVPSPGGEGQTDGTDPLDCKSQPLQPTRACVPSKGRESSAIQIEIDQPDGCLPCGAHLQPCAVEVHGSAITVSTTAQVCESEAGTCACVAPKTTCQLPPLAAGTFTIALANEGPRSGLPPRQLVIAPTGEVACALSTTLGPAMLDLADYGTGCQTDADCTLITTGDACQPCACPNAAISTKSNSRYQGDLRAAVSQCPSSSDAGDVACAGCAEVKAVCNPSHVCDLSP